MFNINTIKILIVHVEVEFNWNHIKTYGWILRKNGFIMDFWNDNTIVMQINGKFAFKKHVIVMSKEKEKNRPPSNEKFKNKMYWNFFDTRKFDFKNLKMIFFCHYVIYSPFHIQIFKLSHQFLNQSHVQGYLKSGLPILLIKSIRNNYSIHNMIVIIIVRILASVKCKVSKCQMWIT